MAEAIRLLDSQGFDQRATEMTDMMVGVMLAGMTDQFQKQFGSSLPADLLEQLRVTIHDHAMNTFRAHLVEIKRQTAEVYAQQFTQAELAHLRELAADPVAVKARDKSKVMAPQLMMIGVRTMKASEPELDAKVKRLITDYVATHGKIGSSS